jgi:hypothetical protein
VSVFYVLPPRPLLGAHLANYLGGWLPGLDWDSETRENLTEALRAAATCHPDVYLIFREELPEGLATNEALMQEFGAEEGDVVIEVRAPGRAELPGTRRWNVRSAA